MPLPNKKAKSIRISEKKPFVISASPKGLVIGKYMSAYLNPKPTNTKKMFLEVEAKLNILGKQMRNIKRNQTEENPYGRRVMIQFFKEAANYTELKWKMLQEKINKEGANKEKIMEEIKQAESDFNYFWSKHRLLMPKKEQKKPQEIKVKKAEQKLDESREKLKRIQKEYGAQSWQAQKALLEHLENFKTFLYKEADYLNLLIAENPKLSRDIKTSLNTIETNFKKIAKRIAFLRERL